MKINGVIISDIHHGALPDEILCKELRDIFLQYIANVDKLDFIFILGDYFDSKLYMSGKAATSAIYIMNEIVSICMNRKDNPKIRIIDGTESHDSGQLKVFEIYMSEKDLDFKIIYNVCEEELFPDFNVLYIPEEYIYNKYDYYNKYLLKENHYDLILGHGVIQEVMSYMKDNSKDTNRRKVPIFKAGELINACKGQIYFGHYHTKSSIQDKLFYTGSFSRWVHGEEEHKGFYNLSIKNGKFDNTFIENTLAQKYVTFFYGYNDKIFKDNNILHNQMEYIYNLIKDDMIDYIRIVLNIPEDCKDSEFIINYVTKKFSTVSKIKVDITNGYVDKKHKVDRTQIDAIYEQMDYIFNKDIHLSQKIHDFMKNKLEVDIPIERIENHLFEELNKT